MTPLHQDAPAGADGGAALRRGLQARERGDRQAALAHFLAAVREQPGAALPLLHMGQELAALGQGELAGPVLRRALAAPDAPRLPILLELGHLARQSEAPEEALAHFEAAAAADPDDAWAQLYLGQQLRLAGRPEPARLALEQAAAGPGPAQRHAVTELAHLALDEGDHAAALRHFERAEAAAPDDVQPALERAGLLRRLGQAEAAAEAYRAVLGRDGRNAPATLGLGLLARAAGDLDAAEAAFRQAAALDPSWPEPWLELAEMLRDAGQREAAEAALAAVLARDPGHERAWLGWSLLHRQAGEVESALEILGRSGSESPAVLAEMALCERLLGRVEAATALLDRALARDPEHPMALGEMAGLLRTRRRWTEALALLRRGTAAHPADVWLRIAASGVLADLGRLDDALAELEAAAAVAAGPDAGGAVATQHLELLRRAGLWREGRDLAREATARWPAHGPLWEGRFNLELLLGEESSVRACLDSMPDGRLDDRARLARMRGQWAEARWRLEEARAHYGAALELEPQRFPWLRLDAARVALLLLDPPAARRELAEFVRLDAAAAALQNRPARISHTHYGQILNEYELDAEALDALRAVRPLPPGERIAPTLALVRRFPDSTPVAIAALVALREAGRLEAGAARPGPPLIPPRIAKFWDAGPPPPDVETLVASWPRHNPGFELLRFDDASARDVIRALGDRDLLQGFDRAENPAQKSDIFRLAWLYAEGGWYSDSDDRCHAPVSSLSRPEARLVLHQEELGSLCNNLVGAAPGHPVIGRALDLVAASLRAGPDDYLWLATGPGALTRAAAAVLAEPGVSIEEGLRDVLVLTPRQLHRAVATHCAARYKTSGRHWMQIAFARN